MASLVKAVFGSSPPSTDSPLAKNHSFNDLSMGAQDHIEDSYNQPETADPSGPPAGKSVEQRRYRAWRIRRVLTPVSFCRSPGKKEVKLDLGEHLQPWVRSWACALAPLGFTAAPC